MTVVGRAVLRDWRHRFGKLGADGTGKGHIEPDPRDVVHGVVYQLAAHQLDTLGGFEGGYRRAELVVRVGDEVLAVHTFLALDPGHPPPPSPTYLGHYAAGMAEHRLPASYARRVLGDAAGVFQAFISAKDPRSA